MKKYFKDSKEIPAEEYYARLLSGEGNLYKVVDDLPPKGAKFDEGKQQWYLLPLEILEPLADVMLIGEKKGYGNFSCLDKFDNPDRRFYDSQMRHTKDSQIDPLAINKEYDKNGEYVGECYHLAGVAFSALMRLYHAKKERGL